MNVMTFISDTIKKGEGILPISQYNYNYEFRNGTSCCIHYTRKSSFFGGDFLSSLVIGQKIGGEI